MIGPFQLKGASRALPDVLKKLSLLDRKSALAVPSAPVVAATYISVVVLVSVCRDPLLPALAQSVAIERVGATETYSLLPIVAL